MGCLSSFVAVFLIFNELGDEEFIFVFSFENLKPGLYLWLSKIYTVIRNPNALLLFRS